MSMPAPFDLPEIKELFNILLDKLFLESGRGAILIATAHVDDQLTSLLEEVMPANLSKNQKERLFKYPGHLSSFSAKIELSYAFRIIDENIYNCLNSLRKIQNDSANSSASFELHELNEKLKGIYNIGPSMREFIGEMAIKMLVKSKMNALNDL